MNKQDFNANHEIELQLALTEAFQTACDNANFDLRCLDWFSYTPDFHRKQKDLKAA